MNYEVNKLNKKRPFQIRRGGRVAAGGSELNQSNIDGLVWSRSFASQSLANIF
jgi:hypothetical protein